MTTDAAAANQQPQFEPQDPTAVQAIPASPPTVEASLLDRVLQSAPGAATAPASQLDQFLQAESDANALLLWFGKTKFEDREQLSRRLNRDVAAIDRLLNDQLNAILHHVRFQKLEATWRGVRHLIDCVEREGDPGVKIRVLHASWREVERDFERAVEFDQSQVFRKIYEEEFGNPGGEPYGVVLGDYEIHPRPAAGHPHDDLAVLTGFAQVAAASFCPFVTSVDPSMFAVDDFSDLEHTLDHARNFQHVDYTKWNALRKSEDSRFLGLTLPRVLMRLPYEDDGTRTDAFCFREDVSGPDRSKYLWGNAAYAFASVLIRSYADSGWLADIRGVQRNVESGGLVTGLPVHHFGTDKSRVAVKSSTDIVITDSLERQLSELGFISLCDCQDTEYSAFYSNQSIQEPKHYDRPAASANARLSTMLQYMFCVSRFAHYIKVIGRDKVGTFGEAQELEQFLQGWIVRYVTSDAEASPQVKARFPLREASVNIREQPGKPGTYQCIMHLAPHYELDELRASVRVSTELAQPRGT